MGLVDFDITATYIVSSLLHRGSYYEVQASGQYLLV